MVLRYDIYKVFEHFFNHHELTTNKEIVNKIIRSDCKHHFSKLSISLFHFKNDPLHKIHLPNWNGLPHLQHRWEHDLWISIRKSHTALNKNVYNTCNKILTIILPIFPHIFSVFSACEDSVAQGATCYHMTWCDGYDISYIVRWCNNRRRQSKSWQILYSYDDSTGLVKCMSIYKRIGFTILMDIKHLQR